MARGDREILKADLDDGYTPIANLILEALALSKLSGVQKGLCMFLFRRTYGWNNKEDEITLQEFADAVDSSVSYVSKQLKQLINWKVIIRPNYKPGKTPTYAFNTRVAQWDKGCINVQGLDEKTKQGLYKCSRVALNKCARVEQSQSLDELGADNAPKDSIKDSIKDSTSLLRKEEANGPQPPNSPPTNQQIIAELTEEYRKTEGITNEKSDYAFIGNCYNKYGYDVTLEAIYTLQARISAGFKPDKPKIYLLGILKNARGDPPRVAAGNESVYDNLF